MYLQCGYTMQPPPTKHNIILYQAVCTLLRAVSADVHRLSFLR